MERNSLTEWSNKAFVETFHKMLPRYVSVRISHTCYVMSIYFTHTHTHTHTYTYTHTEKIFSIFYEGIPNFTAFFKAVYKVVFAITKNFMHKQAFSLAF